MLYVYIYLKIVQPSRKKKKHVIMTTLYIIFLSSVLFLKLFRKKNSGITLCRGRLSQKIYDSHSSYFSFAGYIKFN